MAKTMTEIRDQLSDLEPTESTYAGLGEEDVELLLSLMRGEEEVLAERAVYALARIESDTARTALHTAARDQRMGVRIAAAVSAGDLPPSQSDEILLGLLHDDQAAVRKFAIRSISASNSDAIRRRVAELSEVESDERLRALATQKVNVIGGL